MARLIGVDLPREKRVEIALTYIYGVGRTRATETLAATGISPDVRVKDLDDAQLVALRGLRGQREQQQGTQGKYVQEGVAGRGRHDRIRSWRPDV